MLSLIPIASFLSLQDAYKTKGCCKQRGKAKCQSACGDGKSVKCARKQGVAVRADGRQWYQPTTLQVGRLYIQGLIICLGIPLNCCLRQDLMVS